MEQIIKIRGMFSEDFWRKFLKQVSCFGTAKIEKKFINPNISGSFFTVASPHQPGMCINSLCLSI